MVSCVSHPDVRFGLGGQESHVSQHLKKPVVPTFAGTFESIKSFNNNQGMAGKLPKLCSCNEAHFLSGVALKVGIANVGALTNDRFYRLGRLVEFSTMATCHGTRAGLFQSHS